jgi:lipoate-protein ligase A
MNAPSPEAVPRPNARTTVNWSFDDPARGSWNMALDESLLHWAAETHGAYLRFYQWSEPTLSLGYFQPFDDRDRHQASRNCPVVRRASGGGAILHDRELTYSLALPANHRLSRRPQDLYLAIHRSVIHALDDDHIDVQLRSACEPAGSEHTDGKSTDESGSSTALVACGHPQPDPQAKPDSSRNHEPFLCFQRASPGDILVAGWKIGGSAQRRHRGAILQHGSILLQRSKFAPEVPGLHDLASSRLDGVDLALRMRLAMASALGFDFVFQPPPAEIKKVANELEAAKFAWSGWLRIR